MSRLVDLKHSDEGLAMRGSKVAVSLSGVQGHLVLVHHRENVYILCDCTNRSMSCPGTDILNRIMRAVSKDDVSGL